MSKFDTETNVVAVGKAPKVSLCDFEYNEGGELVFHAQATWTTFGLPTNIRLDSVLAPADVAVIEDLHTRYTAAIIDDLKATHEKKLAAQPLALVEPK